MAKRFDIAPYMDEIRKCLSRCESLRMIASKIGIDHCTLSKKLKEIGVKTPSRDESAKMTWKNHAHPRKGKKGTECPIYGKPVSKKWREKMTPVWIENANRKRKYRKKQSGGYILVYAPNHPSADRTGYVLEHRIILEEHIGRTLLSSEIVHHINGKKDDNRIENLKIVSREEHAKIHKNSEV